MLAWCRMFVDGLLVSNFARQWPKAKKGGLATMELLAKPLQLLSKAQMFLFGEIDPPYPHPYFYSLWKIHQWYMSFWIGEEGAIQLAREDPPVSNLSARPTPVCATKT